MAISESLALHTARVIAHHSDRPQASQSAGLALITCREARPSPRDGDSFQDERQVYQDPAESCVILQSNNAGLAEREWRMERVSDN